MPTLFKNWNPDDGGDYQPPQQLKPLPDSMGCLYILMVGIFLLAMFVFLFFVL
jgi:hypothetical protein